MNSGGSLRSSIGLLQNGQSQGSLKSEIKPTPPTSLLVNASIVAFVGAVFFVVSFTSPYWLQSYAYTYNTFLNMGLWEFCFNGYRHFDFQYDKKYDGCNHVFSYEYQQIREWILPAWLMATQAFMSIALVCITPTLITLSLLLMRWPLKSVMKHEWHMIRFCVYCQGITAVSVLFAIIVFGSMCWSRSWLLNPNFNYLSWSYVFAVICCAFEIASAGMLLKEMFEAKERKREAINLLQMHPQSNFGPIPINYDGSSSHGYPQGSHQGYVHSSQHGSHLGFVHSSQSHYGSQHGSQHGSQLGSHQSQGYI